MRREMKSNALRLIVVTLAISLSGCDGLPSEEPRSTNDRIENNASTKPLSIKDLTTGTKYEEKTFPPILVRTGNEISFYYDYFGEERPVNATLDSREVIYAYEILLKGDQSNLRTAIEAKVSADNSNEVRFKCDTESQRGGGIKWEHKSCSILSGTQRLVIEERIPVSRRPESASEALWESMHMSKLTLTDTDIASKEIKEFVERDRVEREANAAKAQSDV